MHKGGEVETGEKQEESFWTRSVVADVDAKKAECLLIYPRNWS